MRLNKKKITAGVVAVVSTMALGTANVIAAPSTIVSNGEDSGPGSLREALASGSSLIRVTPSVSEININDALIYENDRQLKIIGGGATVRGMGDFDLLRVSNGANLSITNLHFDGGGGYDVENQGGGKGIFVDVPEDRTGIVRLTLQNVSVYGVGHHGVHISDCTLADECGSGGGGGGDGSSASIQVMLNKVLIDTVGYGKFDADGLRVDERGEGDIVFEAARSDFYNAGADGVELDEGNDGHVFVTVVNSFFTDNGGYCAPVMATAENIDHPCVEDDDGEFVLDLDDGFDIDEAGNGSILGSVRNSFVGDNLDEGLDYDEEDAGDIEHSFIWVHAFNNGDEGIKTSEEGAGDVIARLQSVTVINSGDDGMQLEQADDGNIYVTANKSVANSNAKKDLKVVQDGIGEGTLKVRNSQIDEIEAENVDEI